MNEEEQSEPQSRRRGWTEAHRRQLLAHIDEYWFHNGSSPSFSGLAATYGITSASAQYHCKRLEEQGFISIGGSQVGATEKGRRLTRVVLSVSDAGRNVAFRTRVRSKLVGL